MSNYTPNPFMTQSAHLPPLISHIVLGGCSNRSHENKGGPLDQHQ